MISVPDDVRAPATSTAGATIDYLVSATDAVHGPVPVDCAPPSGAQFPVGTTTVHCTAPDPAPATMAQAQPICARCWALAVLCIGAGLILIGRWRSAAPRHR